MAIPTQSQSVVYGQSGEPVGLQFTIQAPWGVQDYALPARIDAILKVLDEQANGREIERRYANRDQASRTAWRIVKDWQRTWGSVN